MFDENRPTGNGDGNGDWGSWKRLVLQTLEDLTNANKELASEVSALRERLSAMEANFNAKVEREVSPIRVSLGKLEVKASIWGALGGILAAIGALLLTQLKHLFGG